MTQVAAGHKLSLLIIISSHLSKKVLRMSTSQGFGAKKRVMLRDRQVRTCSIVFGAKKRSDGELERELFIKLRSTYDYCSNGHF